MRGTFHAHAVGPVQEVEDGVVGPLPRNRQLLEVDHLITVHDLLDQLLCFLVIHCVDFADAAFVCLFEPLVFCLKLFEILCERFIFLGQIDILLLVGSLLVYESFFDSSDK